MHLNTYAFDDESIDRLMLVLQVKYSLVCSVHNHKSGKRIYVFQHSMPVLRDIVIQHMVPSMYYKLGTLTICNLIFYLIMRFYEVFQINCSVL